MRDLIVLKNDWGRWATLSPAYPWEIKTEFKTYPSLLNFLYDDSSTHRRALFNKSQNLFPQEKLFTGIKILLLNPIFKQHLIEIDNNFCFKGFSFDKLYTKVLKKAKEAVSKYVIKGKEVLQKKHQLEMLGAEIVDDVAVFDYNAEQEVQKTIYNTQEDQLKIYTAVGNMISQYYKLYKKLPDFLFTSEINPNIYYPMLKLFPENIAKTLCKVNVEIEPITDLIGLLKQLVTEHDDELWPYFVYPNQLHSGIKTDTNHIKMINYHFDYKTLFSNELKYRLQVIQRAYKPSLKQIVDDQIKKAYKIDGTDSNDNEFTIPYMSFVEDIEQEDSLFADKWSMWVDKDKEIQPKETGFLDTFFSGNSSVTIEPVTVEEKTIESEPVESLTGPAEPVPVVETIPVEPLVPVNTIDLVSVPLSSPKISFEKIQMIGKMMGNTNPLSPFGDHPVFYPVEATNHKPVKYKNMLTAIYNECMKDVLPFYEKMSEKKARDTIIECGAQTKCVDWFKVKGVEMLKKFMNTEKYRNFAKAINGDEKVYCTFLYSDRKVKNLLLESWIGVVKSDVGIPYRNLKVVGYNVAGKMM